jgi:hypothetical protein
LRRTIPGQNWAPPAGVAVTPNARKPLSKPTLSWDAADLIVKIGPGIRTLVDAATVQ